MEARITVIIPAYNEEKVIDDCLNSLTAQTYSQFRAIIVDDCSTDSTLERIKNFCQKYPAKLSYRTYGKVGPGRARNLAARETNSDILAFMDADCIATPTWLAELEKVYTNPQVGSVGGPHIAPPQSSEFQKKVEKFFLINSALIDFYKTDKELKEVVHNPLCNVSYRREVFLDAGGFREDLFPGEDVDIDFKVIDNGHRIFYQPSALVYHHRPETIEQFRKVMHAYGRAQGKLLRDYGFKRKIQILGTAIIFIFLLFLIKNILQGTPVFSLMLFIIFFFGRPDGENMTSLYFNSLEWFNGFIKGFLTNSSPPPGKN